jgi:hypothetical protein
MMLLSPERFNWTKGFLQSPIWDIVVESEISEQVFIFNIPDNCITEQAPSCTISEIVEDITDLEEGNNEVQVPLQPQK